MFAKNKHSVIIPNFIILAVFVLILSVFISCTKTQAGQSKLPNVVFIHIDDLGWKDLAYMGSGFYETPNIDNLASEGLVFTNAYAAGANCAPSRASLLTGQNTPRHGIYTVNPADRGNPKTRQIIASANADSIMPDNLTLGHLFKTAGYATCHIGKWHASSDARNNGFDINIGGDLRGNPGKDGYFAPYKIPFIEQGPDGEYLTDRLTTEAIGFINNNKTKPFFLYMSYYTVHTPLQGKEEKIEKYRQKGGTEGQENPVFAAMVESMDENVGRILNELNKLGLKENTIIVFISDNGGIRGISVQDPLRAGKGSYYEGGIRVPMIMSWPGKIMTAKTDVPVVNLDFFPTFAQIIGVKLPEKILDGTNLQPLFNGGKLAERALYWHFPIYLQHYKGVYDQARDPLFRTRPGTAMRYGNWKLIEYFEDGALELFNLETDLSEQNNLADNMPDKVAELHTMMKEWRTGINAPVPTERNPLYDAAFEKKEKEKVTAKSK